MREGEPRRTGGAKDRLGGSPVGRTRRRVARVANDECAGERAKCRLREDVTDESVVFDDRDLFVLKSRHTGRLLAPVLQGEEGVVTEMGYGAARSDNANNSASLFHDPSTLRVM